MARLSIIDYTLYRQGPDELPLDLYYAAQQTTLSHSAVENKRTNQPLEIVSWCKKPKVIFIGFIFMPRIVYIGCTWNVTK